LGLVQHLPDCKPVPTAVKDYISFPKPNGYQSLHTSVVRSGQTIEVQIRTSWMHAVAEYGLAAHWLYKDERYGSSSACKVFNKYQVAWLETVKEWDEIHNSTEFLEAIRRELLGKRVFVFLRDGKILNLLRGATIIDAAFAIHTEVGLQMTAAEINGLRKPLSYELVNGDVVSILTDPVARPSLDWMRFSRGRSTRAKLRAYFRGQQRAANVQKGWLHLRSFADLCQPLLLARHGTAPTTDHDLRALLAVLGHANATTLDEVCVTLAQTKTSSLHATLAQLFCLRIERVEAIRPASRAASRGHNASHLAASRAAAQATEPIECAVLGPFLGTPENMCPDCMPVLGDAPVVGVAVAARPVEGCASSCYVTVHRPGCPEIQKTLEGREAAAIAWGPEGPEEYVSELQVLCVDRKFLLRDVSDAVALESDILRTSSQTIDDKAILQYKVKVASARQLNDLVSAILRVSGVTSCERISA
jgi:GTP pyrophosphokinase